MSSWKQMMNHPARAIPLAFAAALCVATGLLMLPISAADSSQPADLLTAAFTAVSATCITGLAVVDTATYWSTFGQAVILGMIQLGGFGIMTVATLLAVAITKRWKLTQSLTLQAEGNAQNIGSVKTLLRTVLITMGALEAAIAASLTLRFHYGRNMSWGSSLWYGIFHSISAFNNAGFALYSDNLMGAATDIWLIGPICIAVLAGGLGFPVFHEIRRRWRTPTRWSVNTKVTVLGHITLLLLGTLAFAVFEWRNLGTIGGGSLWDKLLGSFAGGVFPRTAGFNAIDYGQARPETLLVNMGLMFIGGGSAGTSGGIKVGTFTLLAFVVWAEVRGERDVVVARRRIPDDIIRQALTVALLAIGAVTAGTIAILCVTELPLEDVMFEVVSAFGTTGLSTGITANLPPFAKLVLMALMFIGRVGTVTAASALAFNNRHRRYRYPDERMLVG